MVIMPRPSGSAGQREEAKEKLKIIIQNKEFKVQTHTQYMDTWGPTNT